MFLNNLLGGILEKNNIYKDEFQTKIFLRGKQKMTYFIGEKQC